MSNSSKFPVSDKKLNDLLRRMDRLNILETDLEENFILGSGSGGQKINKTSSTVQLIHAPSGSVIRCQESRSQSLNRFIARRLLVEKLEKEVLNEKSKKQHAIEKIRRQKRKRSKRAKEKMLKDKHHRSDIKAQRKAPTIT